MNDNPLDLGETKVQEPVTPKGKQNPPRPADMLITAGWIEMNPGEWIDSARVMRVVVTEICAGQFKVKVKIGDQGGSSDVTGSKRGTLEEAKEYAQELVKRIVKSRKEAS